jgi:hypothetical protein
VLGLVGFAVHFARKIGTDASLTISGEHHCSSAYRSAAQESKYIIKLTRDPTHGTPLGAHP